MNLGYLIKGITICLVLSRTFSFVVVGATLLTKSLEPKAAVWAGHLLTFGFILLFMELGRSGDEPFPIIPTLAYALCFSLWIFVDRLIVARIYGERTRALK